MYESLISSGPRVGTVGKIEAYIETLDAKSARQLRAHIANPATPVQAIRDALLANGFSAGLTTIWQHRHDSSLPIRKAA
ncbi:hypothetical protein [Cryobacterium sp. SO1]|uniref:hypothetical protein n=1 Tax=Cryobacterium sp. SO1 TaxID=1897061 RepID=UPI0010231B27|nr:hypothetical protein [Cryobacterium sp. SO1]RZI36985.1 hypothetical protein BJQ95_00652 [Cryobacterium sp. SO1]